MKRFDEISWKVSEETYRNDPALSYSTLARYERTGFNNLGTLFDRVETPSLQYGSAVDCLMTGSEEEFNERFMVSDYPVISDTLVKITKKLFDTWKDCCNDLTKLDDGSLISTIEDIPWNNHWQAKTRAKKIKEDCSVYYSLLYEAGDRDIIDSITYNDVLNAVTALKYSPNTNWYFEEDNAFDDDVQRFYQLKFKGIMDGVEYRCMSDLLIVCNKLKQVIPIDLKTSSKPEWDFYKSFLEWRYDIQARLYYDIIRQNMDNDPVFKDYELLDYRFIVVNRNTLTPLVWICPFTKQKGTLVLGKDEQIELRSPYQIGKELRYYLDNNPKVPMGIRMSKMNDIKDWINKM